MYRARDNGISRHICFLLIYSFFLRTEVHIQFFFKIFSGIVHVRSLQLGIAYNKDYLYHIRDNRLSRLISLLLILFFFFFFFFFFQKVCKLEASNLVQHSTMTSCILWVRMACPGLFCPFSFLLSFSPYSPMINFCQRLLRSCWCNLEASNLGTCSFSHCEWPHTICRSLLTIFHGPVILPYISGSIWYISIILWVLVQFHSASDLILLVGHCDLYFLDQWFCLLSPTVSNRKA